MSDDLKDLMRSACKAYEAAGVQGENGARAALEAVKREARNEALREAADTARRCKDMPPEDAILALMEDTDDE